MSLGISGKKVPHWRLKPGREGPRGTGKYSDGTCRSKALAGPRRSAVSLVYEPQPLESQQVVHEIDAVREAGDHARHAPGRDRRHPVAELSAQLPANAVHLGGEAVHDARLDGTLGRLADQGARFGDIDLRQPRGPGRE